MSRTVWVTSGTGGKMNRLKENQSNDIRSQAGSDRLTASDTLGVIPCPLRREGVAGNRWKKHLN